MNIFYIFCLLLLVFDLEADTLDSYLSDVLRIKKAYDIIAPSEARKSNKQQSKERRSSKSQRSSSQKSSPRSKSKKTDYQVNNIKTRSISRERLFSDDRIETARISPLGDRIAYIAKNDDTYSVYVSGIDGNMAFEKIIRDISHIEDVEFIGRNKLVYTYKDRDKEAQVMLVDLDTTDRFPMKFDTRADEIQIRKNGCIPEFIAVLRRGKRYTTYRVNATNVSVEKIKDNQDFPPVAYYDDNLEPLLEYDNFSNYRADVYVSADLVGNSNSRRGTEKIDTINDIRTERYISVSNSRAFKLVESKDRIEIQSRDLQKNGKDVQDRCVVSTSPEVKIEHCQVNLDGNGKPIFVRVSKGRSKNIALFSSVREHLDLIEEKFYKSDWQRIDASADGEIWLICVTNPRIPDRYFIYFTDSRRLSEVAVSNKKVNDSIPLQKTECINVRPKNSQNSKNSKNSKDKEDIRVFLTESVEHNQRRPLMIMIGADRNTKSKWNFNPHAQLLANRGCSALVIDPRVRRDVKGSDALQDEINAIMDVVDWCIKDKLCLAGNICLYAKDNNCIAALMAFERNQGIFSGCILLPGDDLKKDGILSYIDNVNDIANPIMVINDDVNSKRDLDLAKSSRMRDAPISYFVYEDRLGNMERASLIELFMSMFYNMRHEKVSSSDIRDFRTALDSNDITRGLNTNSYRPRDDSRDYSRSRDDSRDYSRSRRHR